MSRQRERGIPTWWHRSASGTRTEPAVSATYCGVGFDDFSDQDALAATPQGTTCLECMRIESASFTYIDLDSPCPSDVQGLHHPGCGCESRTAVGLRTR